MIHKFTLETKGVSTPLHIVQRIKPIRLLSKKKTPIQLCSRRIYEISNYPNNNSIGIYVKILDERRINT